MKIGVVLNPIAGMGGRVGLKGTDGKVEEARELGAEPRSPDRGRRAMTALYDRLPDADIYAVGEPMGVSIVREAGYDPTIVYDPTGTETEAKDTKAAVEALDDERVELILFVGGDGTATDVATTLADRNSTTPILGVPAGVKVYSSVFAVSPEDAASIAATFERTEKREVMDIDEDEYRQGEVHTELRAVATVPVADDLQSSKQLGGGTVEALVAGVVDDIEPGVTYVLAPGSTVGAVKEALGFTGSPIGVDVWRAVPIDEADSATHDTQREWEGEVIVKDAAESDILDALGDRNVIVVSPIGGQGFVFGRGNPQLSPTVIRQCDIEIVASRSKLDALRTLRVDTDDPALDKELRGWTKVRVGRFERRMMKIT